MKMIKLNKNTGVKKKKRFLKNKYLIGALVTSQLIPSVTVLADVTTTESSDNSAYIAKEGSIESLLDSTDVTEYEIPEVVENTTPEIPSEDVVVEESQEEILEDVLEEVTEVITENVTEESSIVGESPVTEEVISESETNNIQEEEMISAYSGYQTLSPSEFIQTVGEQAKKVAQENDLYASVMIAQAILESNWGKSTLSTEPNHNLFGIKGSYNGNYVEMRTQEVYNGNWVWITAKFRKYPSYSESLQDNARVLKTTSFSYGNYFYSGAWKSNTNSFRDATQWLQGRYATDTSYASKLNAIITANNLTRFDSVSSNSGNNNNNNSNNNNINKPTVPDTKPVTPETEKPSKNVTHTVKSGDSLWALSNRYGVSIAKIKELNGLRSDMIYVGQKLVISKTILSAPEGSVSTPKPETPSKPKPQPEATKPPVTDEKRHVVKSGDSLWVLSNRYGVSIAKIKELNNLRRDVIYVGQTLKLSVSSSTTTPTPPVNNNNNNNVSKPKPTTTKTYKVVSGDSLWKISMDYGISVSRLKSLNNLTSDIILIGQTLKVA